jgi:hypothetical protein
MKKKFKKSLRKINKGKSNKMIYAVVAGVIIVFGTLSFLLLQNDTPTDKKELMTTSLKYLNNVAGIEDVKIYPDENKVVIVYISALETEKDFQKIAIYAGKKLTYKLKDENVTFILSADEESNKISSFVIKNLEVLEFRKYQSETQQKTAEN